MDFGAIFQANRTNSTTVPDGVRWTRAMSIVCKFWCFQFLDFAQYTLNRFNHLYDFWVGFSETPIHFRFRIHLHTMPRAVLERILFAVSWILRMAADISGLRISHSLVKFKRREEWILFYSLRKFAMHAFYVILWKEV